tara:strand:+ start:658 stop:984 length:327 start_codon:yes stop_codon:yes gene_type:complete
MKIGREIKKIVFEDTDKNHADLKIRLHTDGLKQGEFFRMIVEGYVNRDDKIVYFVEEYKEEKDVQSKAKRTKSKKLYEKAKSTKDKFALNEGEIESIFDIIAKENSEL